MKQPINPNQQVKANNRKPTPTMTHHASPRNCLLLTMLTLTCIGFLVLLTTQYSSPLDEQSKAVTAKEKDYDEWSKWRTKGAHKVCPSVLLSHYLFVSLLSSSSFLSSSCSSCSFSFFFLLRSLSHKRHFILNLSSFYIVFASGEVCSRAPEISQNVGRA